MIYSLHPKKKFILGFKICPRKQVIFHYLESACGCKNELLPNMINRGKYGHFTFLLICPKISWMTWILGQREYLSNYDSENTRR